MAKLILAFGNKAQNGKDTAGEAIVNYYNFIVKICGNSNPPAKIFKFAEALYKVCREEYGMVGKDGPLLQRVGNGRREQFGLDYWIKQLEKEVDKFDGIAVITDVRYTNEADWARSKGGKVIQIIRLNEDGTQFISTDRDPNFISEVQLDSYNFDAVIKSKSADLTKQLAVAIAEHYED